MHTNHLFEMTSISVGSEDSILLQQSGHDVFKEKGNFHNTLLTSRNSHCLLKIRKQHSWSMSDSWSSGLSSRLLSNTLSYSSDTATLTWLGLVLSAHALNKSCHVPGRKHALNKCYVPNSEVCLITRVYHIGQVHLQIFRSVTCLPELASFPGRSHLQYLIAYSMQIRRGKAWEISSRVVASGRQKIDTRRAVPDSSNCRFVSNRPWCYERWMVLTLPC